MKLLYRRLALLLCCLLPLLQVPALLAHGSVTPEGDLCIIRIGFYTAHFKVFQPRSSGAREYCEDLPAIGESVFVMDYQHQELGKVPIEFRIIRDVTGLGRFARIEDLQGISDLDAVTIFHRPPSIEPAVFTVLHEFSGPGAYLGLVTVAHPLQAGRYYTALFPFSVGARDWGLWPLFLALAVVAQGGYWRFCGGYARWSARRRQPKPAAVLMSLLLLLVLPLLQPTGAKAQQDAVLSAKGLYRLEFQSAEVPIPLNRMHDWTLQLSTVAGAPVSSAELTVTGGMPVHNHGLATAPQTTALGNGAYRLAGLRFHMQGAWVLTVAIVDGEVRDTIVVPLSL